VVVLTFALSRALSGVSIEARNRWFSDDLQTRC